MGVTGGTRRCFRVTQPGRQRPMGQRWASRLGHLADIFSEMSKVSCHLEESS